MDAMNVIIVVPVVLLLVFCVLFAQIREWSRRMEASHSERQFPTTPSDCERGDPGWHVGATGLGRCASSKARAARSCRCAASTVLRIVRWSRRTSARSSSGDRMGMHPPLGWHYVKQSESTSTWVNLPPSTNNVPVPDQITGSRSK